MLALANFSDYDIDVATLPYVMDITTFDNPANHVVGTGGSLDGVVELIIDETFLCTGTLLPTRQHILTAAHCIDGAEEVDINFVLSGGVQTFEVAEQGLFVHPDFDSANPTDGADLGIIYLDDEAPAGVADFDIYRDR